MRKRHAIKLKAICGEASDFNPETVINFEEKLLKIIEGYEQEDIENGDDMGGFFRALPMKTLYLKRESCVGGKKSKERLIVILCAFMTGEKEKSWSYKKQPADLVVFKNEKSPNGMEIEPKSLDDSRIMEDGFISRMRKQEKGHSIVSR